jgi:Skp family chaperone for outer membrane proteins
MRWTLVMVFAAVVAVFFILGGGALFSQEPPKANAMKIGVVDLYDITRKWKKWIDLDESIQKEGKASRESLEQEDKNVQEMENKLTRSPLAKNSEEYLKEMTTVQTAKLRLEWLNAKEKERMEKLGTEYMKNLLAEIEGAIKKYGRENGFSLILKVDEIPTQERSLTEMQIYVRFKQVMFYDDGINITPAIVDILQKK